MADQEPKQARFMMVLMDRITEVQLPVGTEDIDKFTKTDMMKVVREFKKGVQKEEKLLEDRKKMAKKGEKDESN